MDKPEIDLNPLNEFPIKEIKRVMYKRFGKKEAERMLKDTELTPNGLYCKLIHAEGLR